MPLTFHYDIACEQASEPSETTFSPVRPDAIIHYYDSAKPYYFSVFMERPNVYEAQVTCDEFPKYLKLKARRLSKWEDGKTVEAGCVQLDINLSPDGVTGTVNETGLKRIKRFFEIAKRLGFDVQRNKGFANSSPLNADNYGWTEPAE